MKKNDITGCESGYSKWQLFRTFFANMVLNWSRFSLLLVVFTVAFWVLAAHSILAANKSYLLPSDYLGTSDVFVADFAESIKEKLTEYFGILVSFVGFRYVIRAFLG